MSRAARRQRGGARSAGADGIPDLESGEGIGEGKEGAESSDVDDKPGDKAEFSTGADEETGLLNGGAAEADSKAPRRGMRGKVGTDNGASAGNEENNKNDNGNSSDNIQTESMRVLEPMRQDPIKAMGLRQKRLERLPAEGVPETHYIGQIKSGQNMLEDSTEGASIRWRVDTGKAWQCLGGSQSGQTHVCYCKARDNEAIPFNHPLDLHFAEAGLQGWGAPRISFQCYRLDWTGRRILHGYGFAHLPTAAGFHSIEVQMWRPTGTRNQELEAYLLGRTPALVNHEPIYDSAWRERCRLVTIPAGCVTIEMTVMTRNQGKNGIDQQNI